MSGNNRASIFDSQDDDLDVSGFAPKTAPSPDAPSKDQVLAVSEAASFKSREAGRAKPAETAPTPALRQRRRYRTGRNIQFNTKVSQATQDGFYRIADAQDWVLGEVLEHALAALERELKAKA